MHQSPLTGAGRLSDGIQEMIRIAGWSHSRFGKLADCNLESLIRDVGLDAIKNAGLELDEVDGIWLGNFNGGLHKSNFISSWGLLGEESLRFRPTTRVENACASGSAAVFSAIDALESGRISTALVIGAETMTSLSTQEVTDVLARAGDLSEEYGSGLTFPGIFANFASDYFEKFGNKSEILARVAEKNHANGSMNPWAHMQKPLNFEFCNSVSERNPIVAPPLRRTDCSPISDGAAAVVITNKQLGRVREVEITGRSQINDFLPMSRRNFIKFEGPALAWKRALQASDLTVWDLDFAEIHDCFTIAELLTYEAMGLAEFGQGERIILDGTAMRNGKLPINVSGGLKAKGHPIGATGVSMFVLSAMQLMGEAGSLQLPQADKAGIFNMGGSAVANYVAVLERN